MENSAIEEEEWERERKLEEKFLKGRTTKEADSHTVREEKTGTFCLS
jgi:hypothetical protein